MKKMMMGLLALGCAGCVSVSDVVPVGKSKFTVSSEMAGQFPSWSEVKQLALKRANTHCESLGKIMTVDKWETHGARGWTPLNAELTFECVDNDNKVQQPN